MVWFYVASVCALLGCGWHAPLAGTGVVTSVPSDAPDDYMALHDLKAKPGMLALVPRLLNIAVS